MINIYVEIAGIFVAAVAGAIASSRVRMDLFGVIVCGTIAAVGGGTIRDIIIDAPVFWVKSSSEIYLISAILSSMFAFTWVRYLPVPVGSIRILDAIVLAVFAFMGASKTYLLGYSPLVVISMGVVTGTAGGMLRDVLTGNVPYVLRPGELYATAVFIGCGLFCVLVQIIGFTVDESMIPTISIIFFFRVAAIRWNWNLPSYRCLFNPDAELEDSEKEHHDEE